MKHDADDDYGPRIREKVVIDVSPNEPRDVIMRQLIDALRNNVPNDDRRLFQYGGELVAIVMDSSRSGKLDILRPTPRAATKFDVMMEIARGNISCKKRNANGKEITVAVPQWALSYLIDTHGDGFVRLSGMAEYPILNAVGEFLQGRLGYDEKTGLYVNCEPVTYHKFATPQEAYRYLTDEVLHEVWFKTPQDCAKAVMMGATMLVRRTQVEGGAPLWMVTAPEPATGKTMMCSMMIDAVTGIPSTMFPWDDSAAERRKVLYAVAKSNPASMLIDNIGNGWTIRDTAIERYCSTDWFSDRELGVSVENMVPATAALIFTGNNIKCGSLDMASRVVEIRLERPSKAPEYENKNPLHAIREKRSKIISALVRILQEPTDPDLLPSTRFPNWAEKVAAKVQKAAGMNDCLADWDHAKMRELHDNSEALGDLLEAMGDREWSTGELKDDAGMLQLVAALDYNRKSALFERGLLKADGSIAPRVIFDVLDRYRDHVAMDFRLRGERKYGHASKKKKLWYYKAVAEK